MAEHKCHSKTRIYDHNHFYNAINKYGYHNFKYEVLLKIKSKSFNNLKILLDVLEEYYIRKYNTTNKKLGYNVNIGGSKRGPEAKIVNVFDKSGNIIDSGTITELALKYNCSIANVFGNLKKNLLFKKKYILKYEDDKSEIKIKCKSQHIYYKLDLEGKILQKYNSIMDCEAEGFDLSTIVKCCLHPDKNKSHKGFKWSRVKI